MRHLLIATLVFLSACGGVAAPASTPAEPVVVTSPAPTASAGIPFAIATGVPTLEPSRPPTPIPAPTASPRPSPLPTAAPSRAPAAVPTPAAVRYVAIGASDTVGVGASDPKTGSWPALLSKRLADGSTYTNLGVSGSLAFQARAEQLPAALAAKPTLVTVWLAVNDLNALVPSTRYGAELGAIVDDLVAGTDARVFVGTVPDLRVVPLYTLLDPEIVLARVNSYNAQIAEIAARHPARVRIVDLFTGSAALVSASTVAEDGFHPSDAGYALIADRFATALATAGITLR
jgi:lysophospholipase L1-like esterase